MAEKKRSFFDKIFGRKNSDTTLDDAIKNKPKPKPKNEWELRSEGFMQDMQEAYNLSDTAKSNFYANPTYVKGLIGEKDGKTNVGSYINNGGASAFIYTPVAIATGYFGEDEAEIEANVIKIAKATRGNNRFNDEALDVVINNPKPYIELSRKHFSKTKSIEVEA